MSRLAVDAAIVLILISGLRLFRTPPGAREGNLLAALALLLALGTVAVRHPIQGWNIVLAALAIGAIAGGVVAFRVNMLQIPAMVAFQHGAGGVAAVLVSFVELTRDATSLTTLGRASGLLGIAIGAATFSASMVAGAKLANRLRQTPKILPVHSGLLLLTLAVWIALAIAAWNRHGPALSGLLAGATAASILAGILFSIRVGGADMPVLISFLNAAAGLAASLCGIIIQDRLLIACGATVAASGSILTHVMCKAMNRNLFSIFAGRQAKATAPSEAPPPPSKTTETTEALQAKAVQALRSAKTVVVIPGYGMALAHAQFAVVNLANRLRTGGTTVRFAVHPVAGRMPGHMHVLLAEAEVDADLLCEMDQVNGDFKNTDLALVVGACDVVNPAAIRVEGTPISGMPILLAHEAKAVLVCNLDAKPGYSGVQNPLYTDPRTILLLGDADASVRRLLDALGPTPA